MRAISLLGAPPMTAPVDAKIDWLMWAVQEIAQASQTEALAVADPFTLANTTTQHSLDGSTATLADVTKVLGTLIADMKKRGVNSGIG